MNNTTRKQTSWGWIIFWFIIFWPVGLILLIKRQSSDRSATLRSNRGVFIASYILMGLGAIYLMTGIVPAFLLFGGGGVVIFLYARKSKKKGEHYKAYIAMIVNQNQTSIDAIAAAAGVSYDVAVSEIQEMINAGYIPNAYVDVAQRRVVLANAVPQWEAPMPVQVNSAAAQMAVVVCTGCSANNRIIIGQSAECEYCGTLLQ
ncbi:MAG: hypothetical protein FWD05_09065 [Oscillospiraceae bacterium]|nr:hypothetical protein [Oscillospiraceae bacterium]